MKLSAGLALHRENSILLVHPTGNSWWGTYGIPKGLIDKGETIFEAAIRETAEEIGFEVPAEWIDKRMNIAEYKIRSGKTYKKIFWYSVNLNPIPLSKIKDVYPQVPKENLQLKEVDWASFVNIKDVKKRINKKQISIIETIFNAEL